jgi:hypothetical protein
VEISNSVLKNHLRDVYWITGGACAGKTTVANLLAAKYGFAVFPDRFSEYQQAADFDLFPALRYPNPTVDWEWFFNRDINDYVGWLEHVCADLLQFIVVDLIGGEFPRPIIVEQFTEPVRTAAIAARDRMVTLYATDTLIESELLARPDHAMILECINENTKNPKEAERNVIRASVEASHRSLDRATSVDCRILRRSEDTQPQELLTQVENHFGLSRPC